MTSFVGLKRSTLQLIALQAQVLTSINTNDNQEEKMEECVKRGDQQVNSKPPIWKRKISNANTNTTAASNDSPMLTTQKKMLINLKLNPSRRSSGKDWFYVLSLYLIWILFIRSLSYK